MNIAAQASAAAAVLLLLAACSTTDEPSGPAPLQSQAPADASGQSSVHTEPHHLPELPPVGASLPLPPADATEFTLCSEQVEIPVDDLEKLGEPACDLTGSTLRVDENFVIEILVTNSEVSIIRYADDASEQVEANYSLRNFGAQGVALIRTLPDGTVDWWASTPLTGKRAERLAAMES